MKMQYSTWSWSTFPGGRIINYCKGGAAVSPFVNSCGGVKRRHGKDKDLYHKYGGAKRHRWEIIIKVKQSCEIGRICMGSMIFVSAFRKSKWLIIIKVKQQFHPLANIYWIHESCSAFAEIQMVNYNQCETVYFRLLYAHSTLSEIVIIGSCERNSTLKCEKWWKLNNNSPVSGIGND